MEAKTNGYVMLTKLIDEVNRKTILSRDINDATSRISTLTQMLSE